jgi:putative toxin-antitoxin system antitoxin component (TIGR02293 family)
LSYIWVMSSTKKNMVEEAALAYSVNSPSYMRAILGGKAGEDNTAFTDLEMIKITREGLKKGALTSLASYLNVTMDQLSTLLHTSYRNLLRKDASDVLDSYKTEKVLELAAFTSRGIQVVGSKTGFQQWVHTPILALGNRKPLEFLDTTFGIQMVSKVLGRLEQGVYS